MYEVKEINVLAADISVASFSCVRIISDIGLRANLIESLGTSQEMLKNIRNDSVLGVYALLSIAKSIHVY